LVGETEYVQEEVAPSWLIVNVWPATVIVPVRGDVLVFAATAYVAVPLPVPLPDVIVTQGRVLVAVQGQLLADAVTVMLPVPELAV
jgi:hypothetical protein